MGNVLSFAITAELARRSGASIVLRIDDMDRERTVHKYVQDIFDTLGFMDIPWHEGPRDVAEFEAGYSQVHRQPLYNAALQHLREGGYLFACDCSRSQIAAAGTKGYPGTCRDKGIPLDARNVSWRLRTDDRQLIVKHPDGSGIVSQLQDSVRDFVIRKKDGLPAYQLTSVVDDLHFGIDLVVRGEDLWDSTLAQLYLSTLLPDNTFRDTAFYHHPLLESDKGEKLSKTAGDVSVQYLRNEGIERAEIYRLIAGKVGLADDVSTYRDLAEGLLQLWH